MTNFNFKTKSRKRKLRAGTIKYKLGPRLGCRARARAGGQEIQTPFFLWLTVD